MKRTRIVVSLLLGATCLLWGTSTAALAANRGTVKIDGLELDQHPNNEPHPGCLFEVDFYGFGANLNATSTFYAWPPTGSMQQIHQVSTTLDNDDSTGGGSIAGYDGGTGLIDLSPFLVGIVPHPQQGFHVKLQVDVPRGTDSAAFSKFKVFWVTCEYPPSIQGGELTSSTSRPGTTEREIPITAGTLALAALASLAVTALIRRRLRPADAD
jgi:hypothetical protein